MFAALGVRAGETVEEAEASVVARGVGIVSLEALHPSLLRIWRLSQGLGLQGAGELAVGVMAPSGTEAVLAGDRGPAHLRRLAEASALLQGLPGWPRRFLFVLDRDGGVDPRPGTVSGFTFEAGAAAPWLYTADDLGLRAARAGLPVALGPQETAAATVALLEGRGRHEERQAVMLAAGLMIAAARRDISPRQGVQLAREVLVRPDTGGAGRAEGSDGAGIAPEGAAR